MSSINTNIESDEVYAKLKQSYEFHQNKANLFKKWIENYIVQQNIFEENDDSDIEKLIVSIITVSDRALRAVEIKRELRWELFCRQNKVTLREVRTHLDSLVKKKILKIQYIASGKIGHNHWYGLLEWFSGNHLTNERYKQINPLIKRLTD